MLKPTQTQKLLTTPAATIALAAGWAVTASATLGGIVQDWIVPGNPRLILEPMNN